MMKKLCARRSEQRCRHFKRLGPVTQCWEEGCRAACWRKTIFSGSFSLLPFALCLFGFVGPPDRHSWLNHPAVLIFGWILQRPVFGNVCRSRCGKTRMEHSRKLLAKHWAKKIRPSLHYLLCFSFFSGHPILRANFYLQSEKIARTPSCEKFPFSIHGPDENLQEANYMVSQDFQFERWVSWWAKVRFIGGPMHCNKQFKHLRRHSEHKQLELEQMAINVCSTRIIEANNNGEE